MQFRKAIEDRLKQVAPGAKFRRHTCTQNIWEVISGYRDYDEVHNFPTAMYWIDTIRRDKYDSLATIYVRAWVDRGLDQAKLLAEDMEAAIYYLRDQYPCLSAKLIYWETDEGLFEPYSVVNMKWELMEEDKYGRS